MDKLACAVHARIFAVGLLLAAVLFALGAGSLDAIACEPDASSNPCVPSEGQLLAYEADGTLDERLAFVESLGNGSFDPSLVRQRSRTASVVGSAASVLAVPEVWKSGMGTSGPAHILALRVTFPASEGEPELAPLPSDSAEALQALIGPMTSGVECDVDPKAASEASYSAYPYESLSSYYLRSSYGKLFVDGAVYEYTAEHPASYYGQDMSKLFVEALMNLDGRVDFSRFDGNGDGLIDGVYVHFACENPEWGTEWWSNQRRIDPEIAPVLDGVRLHSTVTLHLPSNSEEGVRTAIHETGHVLGLPDYYSYSQEDTANTGLLSFDMMNTNVGDHNGFSKWMLGWIEEDDIVRIVANESGITVKDGSQEARFIPSEEGQVESATVQTALSTFAAAESGRIAVVSDSERLLQEDGMFSSYYLVQYESFAGNQSVRIPFDGALEELPSGFRVFRVRAELDAEGYDFVRSNSKGQVHDQLIECVDPDGRVRHGNYAGVPVAESADSYGCLFNEGDVLAPTTDPSTNFYEALNLGFTGLCVDFADEGDGAGTIAVRYSSEAAPDGTSALSIVAEDDASVLNIDSLRLRASKSLVWNAYDPQRPETAPMGAVYIQAAGVRYYPSVVLDGDRIDLTFAIPAMAFSSSGPIEVVFPARTFVTGYQDGDPVCSPELRVPLRSATLPTVLAEGEYGATDADQPTSAVSGVVRCEDGALRFVQVAGEEVRLCTVADGDWTSASARTVATLPDDVGDVVAVDVVPTDGGLFARIEDSYGSTALALWTDVATGSVVSSLGQEFDLSEFVSAENGSIVGMIPYPVDGVILKAFFLQEDGSVDVRYGWTSGSSLHGVATAFGSSSGLVAVETQDVGGSGDLGLRILPSDELRQALVERGFESFDALMEAGFPDVASGIVPVVTLTVPDCTFLQGVSWSSEGYAVAALSPRGVDWSSGVTEVTVAVFSGDGALRSETALPCDSDANGAKVLMGDDGIAYSCAKRLSSSGRTVPECQTFFLSDSLEETGRIATRSAEGGVWLASGGWLDVGVPIGRVSTGAGSPILESVAESGLSSTKPLGSTEGFNGVGYVLAVPGGEGGGPGDEGFEDGLGEGSLEGEGAAQGDGPSGDNVVGERQSGNSLVLPPTKDGNAFAAKLAFACALASCLAVLALASRRRPS